MLTYETLHGFPDESTEQADDSEDESIDSDTVEGILVLASRKAFLPLSGNRNGTAQTLGNACSSGYLDAFVRGPAESTTANAEIIVETQSSKHGLRSLAMNLQPSDLASHAQAQARLRMRLLQQNKQNVLDVQVHCLCGHSVTRSRSCWDYSILWYV